MDLSSLQTYKNKNEFLEDIRKRSFEMEMNYHGCAQVVVQTFLDLFDEENKDLLKSASPFAAGVSLTGNNCGAMLGGLMILGTVCGREDVKEGMPGILSGIKPMRRLVKFFRQNYGCVDCKEITNTDLADPEKAKNYFDSGGLEKCANIIAEVSVFVGGLIYDGHSSGNLCS